MVSFTPSKGDFSRKVKTTSFHAKSDVYFFSCTKHYNQFVNWTTADPLIFVRINFCRSGKIFISIVLNSHFFIILYYPNRLKFSGFQIEIHYSLNAWNSVTKIHESTVPYIQIISFSLWLRRKGNVYLLSQLLIFIIWHRFGLELLSHECICDDDLLMLSLLFLICCNA